LGDRPVVPAPLRDPAFLSGRLVVHNGSVDGHQRAMWGQMLAAVSCFRDGQVPLGKLVADLRGLYVEADPDDPAVRRDFENVWVRIDIENEARTESWTPPGVVSDATIAQALDFAGWVEHLLAVEDAGEHG
jgi:hypothetical protein